MYHQKEGVKKVQNFFTAPSFPVRSFSGWALAGGGFIKFTVTDDGAGFTQERLEQLKNELEHASDDVEKLSSVYGVYNVNRKLKLYYGDKTDGLVIQSEHKKGSSISFTIPCIFEEQDV